MNDASATLTTIDDRLIEQVTARIVESCNPEALYLFGSAARGEARAGSDLDLLVVVELDADVRPHEKAGALRRLFDGWLVSFDILVQTPSDFRRTKDWVGHVAHRAVREGSLLHCRKADACA